MARLKWILFDCMETLVDLDPLPQTEDYASWSFHGSGVEAYWDNFDVFSDAFQAAGNFLTRKLPANREWTATDRFRFVCKESPYIPDRRIDDIITKLEQNFFKSYSARCVVHNDVIEILPELFDTYQIGVVSNFKTENGIERLLEKFDIRRYFKFVTTSIKFGWRKPHDAIYKECIEKTGFRPDEILFVGDDLLCDYRKPKQLGINALLLDRFDRQSSLAGTEKISSFYELYNYLKAADQELTPASA